MNSRPMKFLRRLVLLISFVGVVLADARAAMWLSATTFPLNDLPYIYTNESLPYPYKLRAKFQPNFHGIDGWNNNGGRLTSVPGVGSFTVELYWVLYASDYATAVAIGPRTFVTVSVQGAANNAPNIRWTNAYSIVQADQPYYIQALGSDSNGNLTRVDIYKNWTPFAFVGGGNGYSNYSGNETSDTGGASVQYQARALDGGGASSPWIYHNVTINRKPTITWEVNPAVVNFQTYYAIRARGQDGDGNLLTVNIYRDEVPWAFELNGTQANAYSDNSDYAGSYASVTYRAEAIDATGKSSGSISHTVHVANSPPNSSWNTAAINTYIGQSYSFTAFGSDPDGNLRELRAYESAWEDVSGTWVQRQNYQHFDTVPSAGGPVSKPYTHVGGSPWKWKYQYVVIARDTAGVENWPNVSFGNILDVTLNNRPPALPTLVSTAATMTLGQAVVLSGAGSDPDGNATQHWLWYRGPDQGPDEWVALTISSYAAGTGNTVVNFSFTPTKIGTYYFKTQVNDPYNLQSIINVAPLAVMGDTTPPNPPTNLVLTGVTATRAVLAWTISNSTDIGEQHVYWRPVAGGATTDIPLGKDAPGVTVPGLSAGGNYLMSVKARDFSGNYSAASNEVLVTTPVPVVITISPESMTVNPGANVTFNVSATGSAPLNYQWLKNGSSIAGAKGASLTLNGVQTADAGSYSVVVGNSANSVQSGAAVLAINSAPVITHQPVAQTVTAGATVTFSVAATGTGALSYQWRKNNSTIPGATATSYTLFNVQAGDAAGAPGYTVVVSNYLGSTTSSPAPLAVNTTQPVRLALQYWQANDYPGRFGGGRYDNREVWIAEYQVENEDLVDTDGDGEGDSWRGNGTYHTEGGCLGLESFWIEDSPQPDGEYGSRWDTTAGTFGYPLDESTGAYNPAATNRGYLLNNYPTYYSQISFRTWAYAPSGNCSSFTATVYSPGGGVINSAAMSSGSYAQFTLYSWWYGAGSYRVDISYSGATATPNTSGTVSYFIPVGVAVPPTITVQPGPTNLIANVGSSLTYTVVAQNATGYQWEKNTVPISGANGPSLTLDNLTTGHAGSYRVVVRNASGSTTSTAVALTVTNEPFADNDSDGIPNGIEVLLQTNAQNAGSSDASNNTLQLKIQQPKP